MVSWPLLVFSRFVRPCPPRLLFGGRGQQRHTNTHFPDNIVVLALPPSAARPKTHDVPETVWFVGLGMPGLQKNTWPNKHFGIPLVRISFTTVWPEGFNTVLNGFNRCLIRF